MRSLIISSTLLVFLLFASTQTVFADGQAEASPKNGWGDFEIVEKETQRPWWKSALMWFPNRFLDAVDIFRVDAGVGLSAGGVVRATKYGQAGFRTMFPASARLGLFGRKPPFMVERSNEFGIGPAFVNSKDREVCVLELGLGGDLVIVGAYGGICPTEVVDFALGLVFIDIKDDDL